MTDAPPPIDNPRWIATVQVGDSPPVTKYSDREDREDAKKHVIEMMSFVKGTEYETISLAPYKLEEGGSQPS